MTEANTAQPYPAFPDVVVIGVHQTKFWFSLLPTQSFGIGFHRIYFIFIEIH